MTNPPESFAYDVFISYSTQNKDWGRGELLPGLKAAGLRCCIDLESFQPGEVAIQSMERAVTTNRKILLVLTPQYVDRVWTELEARMAQYPDPLNRNLRIIPLLKEPCEPPPSIAMLNYIDFTRVENLGIAWTQLLTALGKPPIAEAPQSNMPAN
jgi:TIR domain